MWSNISLACRQLRKKAQHNFIGQFKDRCRCDLNITLKNKTRGYKRKNGAVKMKGEVKKPCGLHVRELSAERVQCGEGDNVRWEIVQNGDSGG